MAFRPRQPRIRDRAYHDRTKPPSKRPLKSRPFEGWQNFKKEPVRRGR
jgi:hypothetical protein